MSEKNFKIEKIEKLPDMEAEILGEIALDFLILCRKEALKHLNSTLTLPGFRPGQVPEETLAKTLGEMRVLEETAEIALAKEYEKIVAETKLRPIVRPQISVTKLAPGIPLSFKIRLVLEPEFTLPDYKKIAQETQDESSEKRRMKILEALSKETKFDLPAKFVEAEVHHMLHHFKHDLEKAGIAWEPYLKEIKKTEEEVLKEWKESVEARAKNELILSKIAEKENLKTYKEVFELLEKN